MRTSILALVCVLALMPMASATPMDSDLVFGTPTSLGQAIVGFHDKLPDIVDDQLGGLTVLATESRGNYIVVAAPTLEVVRSALASVSGVAYIEDDQILHALVIPNDSSYSSQYGPAQMGAEAAWDVVGYGSSSITVAVIDSGVRSTHQDLAANHIGGHDYVNNDGTPNDDCGHGTHVQGTVAAVTNNGVGVAGMSQASILHYKALGNTVFGCSGSQSGINSAIYAATDAGADIISMSLGGGGFSSSGNDAVNYAWNAGVLVVAASGNDSNTNGVGYPAAYDNAIAVGALTSSKVRASYSNGGAELEIVAGGSSVYSTTYNSDSSYGSMSGTSMATPHVAGALALALSCDSTVTNTQMRSLMASTAEDLGASGWDNLYGHGLLRLDSLVNAIGTCGTGNNAPTSSFTYSANLLDVNFDGSGSSDSDGTIASYAWNFGDGSTATVAAPSHAFASTGTYTVTLTVTDDDGATGVSSQSISVTDGTSACSGGDPTVAEIADGATEAIAVSSGSWTYRKVCVPADATSLTVTMAGSGLDADLYTREGAAPSSSTYDCRPYTSGSNEECTSTPTAGWTYVGIYGYSGSGTVTLTADHNGGGAPPTNGAPTASFTYSTNDLAATFDGSASSDPDGDTLSYSWTFGDGSTGSGAGPVHAYAAAGTYTVTLTVDDGNGATDSTSASVTVSDPAPPPAGCTDNGDGVTIMDSGTGYQATVASGQWAYGKICVAEGQSLNVDMTGPGCGFWGCSFDADLYVKQGAQPTTSSYDCRPYLSGNDESCAFSNATGGWWYVGVYAYTGSGTVDLSATTS